jgi:hypothetical protein
MGLSSTPLHHFAAATVRALYYSCWCNNPLGKSLMVNNFGHNLDGQWQALTHGILVQLELQSLISSSVNTFIEFQIQA